MAYFLKLLGLKKSGLPEIWWEDRKELRTGVFFSSKPRKIRIGDHLIYYAVGGSKRIVAEAEVTGEPSQEFEPPDDWPPERRKRFSWRMPVRLLQKCAANGRAPLARDHYKPAITGGSYRRLTDQQGRSMSEAIRAAATSA